MKLCEYSQLFGYTVRLKLCRLITAKKTAVNSPITFEEIVIVMINNAHTFS